MGACEGMSSTRGYNLIQFDSCGILFGSVTSAMMNRTIPARVISSKPDYYMLLRFQKAAVRGNYETGNQAFSMHLGFLIHTGGNVRYAGVTTNRKSPLASQIRSFHRINSPGTCSDSRGIGSPCCNAS